MPQSWIFGFASNALQMVGGKMPHPQLIHWKIVLTPQICLDVSSVKGYVYVTPHMQMDLICKWVPKLDSLANEYQIYHKSFANGPYLQMSHNSFANEYLFANEEWA